MRSDRDRLRRWLQRAQPPRVALIKALVAGTVSSITALGLFVGAIALLVVSSSRPGLRAVAGILIVIELFAFLRSPIRFNERMSAHRLGFAAVSRWRRWLLTTIGRWTVRRWRTYARGGLLERALRDTDELQDLWLRFVLPTASTLAAFVVGDVVIALLAPQGGWIIAAALVAVVQLIGVIALGATADSLIAVDRSLRRSRGEFRATLVALSTVSPELSLLGARTFLEHRLDGPREVLAAAESRAEARRRRSAMVAPVATMVAVAALRLVAPVSAPVWTVVSLLLAMSTFEGLTTIRAALDTAVAVSAAAERLEDLDAHPTLADARWPGDTILRAQRLKIREADRTILDDGSFEVAPGRHVAVTGPSGSGKSTLLRVLAGLDDLDDGVISIGNTPITEIDEEVLRAHVAFVPGETGLLRGYAQDVLVLGRTIARPLDQDLIAVGIDVEPTTKWDEVSRGEGQRIAVVRALAIGPDIVILDEPTSGLGRDETTAVLNLLSASRATVIIATHDDQIVAWSDLVIDLNNGDLTTSA